MKTVLLLALLTVLAISATARIILQHEYESGAANPHSGKNHRRGRHFNFRKHRNASSTFDSIDKEFGTALLERVLRNSDLKGGRHQLVHDLESDNDMVRSTTIIQICILPVEYRAGHQSGAGKHLLPARNRSCSFTSVRTCATAETNMQCANSYLHHILIALRRPCWPMSPACTFIDDLLFYCVDTPCHTGR